MRLLLIAALSLCVLIIDYQIYKYILTRTKPNSAGRWMRRCYVGYALITDIFIFAFVLLAFGWPFYGPNSISPLPLWFAWFFFFNAIPKCIYALFYLTSICTGKRVAKRVRQLGMALALYAVFILVKGAFYNTRHFEIKHVTIESTRIPIAFDGYRMALFSDVHLGNLSGQQRFLHRFVEEVNRLCPDVIFFTGDMVNMYASEITPRVQSVLSQLQAPDGIFSVLGNHDMGAYFGKRAAKIGLTPLENTNLLIHRQEEMGWKVLQNESVLLCKASDSIALCGVPYPPLPPLFSRSLTHFDLERATSQLDSDHFNIMLCHTPKVWETMRDSLVFAHIDLVLSGHTHAMQLKLKSGSWQWSPAKWLYPYWSGMYGHNGRYLYVNDGLGYVLYPMRVGSKPEITLFTLKTGG